MKKKCLAAVLYGARDMRLEYVPIPQIGPEEVLVQVKACALCGSDLHAYIGKHFRLTLPRILGHEFSGVIFKKGKKVSGWEIGQRVCCDVALPCEECEICRQGRRNLCANSMAIGFNADGAYCEFVKVPQRNVFALPEKVSFEEGSMIQTLGVAYNGVKRKGEVKVQDQVLIFGSGPIGLCALAVAKTSGANVFMVDPHDYRLEIAKAMGAEETLNAKRKNLVKTILDLTKGKGVDKVIEAVGGRQDVTLWQATQVVKRGGLIVAMGTFSKNRATLGITEFISRELELRGSRGNLNDFPDCIELVSSRKVKLDLLISHHMKLEEVEKGLQLMEGRKENIIKVIIYPEKH